MVLHLTDVKQRRPEHFHLIDKDRTTVLGKQQANSTMKQPLLLRSLEESNSSNGISFQFF